MAALSSMVNFHSDGSSRLSIYAVTLTATSFDLSLSTGLFVPYRMFLKRGTGAMNGTYNLIDISLEHKKYIGFSWPFSGVLWYFAFSILVFGLV